MGHFLAPERIPPPALASDTEAKDGEAEEIEDYAANLRFTSPIGKYPLFLEKRMLGAFTVMDLSGIGSSFDADAQARVVLGMGTVDTTYLKFSVICGNFSVNVVKFQ